MASANKCIMSPLRGLDGSSARSSLQTAENAKR